MGTHPIFESDFDCLTEMSAVSCNLVMEKLDASGCSIMSQKSPNSELGICRKNGDICMQVTAKGRDQLFYVSELRVHGRFIKDGKATITFVNRGDREGHKRRFLVNNAPPGDLERTLRLLMIKHHAAPPIKRKNLGSNEVDEISPLRPVELKAINQRLVEHHQCGNKTPTKNNTTPVRKLKRRRLQAEKQGLVEPKVKKELVLIKDEKIELNQTQQNIIARVRQGESVFFTGAAGTGKSFVLKHLIGALPAETAAVTASTGCAAVHISGQTLHGWAGVGVEPRPLVEIVAKMRKNKRLLRNWVKTKVLIIDEVSMVDGDFFDYLESIGRQLKDLNRPFGGIQLVLCGDFLQLPPVSKNKEALFCFQSKSWDECVPSRIELREVYRQSGDPEFAKLLNNIRVGQVPGWVERRLAESADNHEKLDLRELVPTRLMTHNKQVEMVNQQEYEKLGKSAVEHVFDAADSTTVDKVRSHLDKLLPQVSRRLRLKKGAQVMLLRNVNVAAGLVNGSRGVIVGFDRENGHPRVTFHADPENEHIVKREKFSMELGGSMVSRAQYPLQLAWAMSIHKSQGMSLDLASISLAKCFESGQAYVALSRCRSYAGLRVLDFEKGNIRANQAALAFHDF